MPNEVVDQHARDLVRDTRHELTQHRQATEIHLAHIERQIEDSAKNTNMKIDRVESVIKWAGSLLVTLLLSVLGWSVVQQITANQMQQQELKRQIELLEAQEQVRVLTPGASKATSASHRH